jgi:hypothetical protein
MPPLLALHAKNKPYPVPIGTAIGAAKAHKAVVSSDLNLPPLVTTAATEHATMS